MIKHKIIILCSFMASILLVAPMAHADCYSCFDLIKVNISLKSGDSVTGYAYIAYEENLSTADKILIIDNYYEDKILPISTELKKIPDYREHIYYDTNKSLVIIRSNIISITKLGKTVAMRGDLIGLDNNFLKTVLSNKPKGIIRIGINTQFIYDDNFDNAAFRKELNNCRKLRDNSYDCEVALLDNFKEMLSYSEDFD